ncbi:MAG: ABC transporter substrate-binding protein [Bacteroides sp.]|nr:ABC transporter substrate-binding protein [Bacteroides sp.]
MLKTINSLFILFCLLPAMWSCGSGRGEQAEGSAGRLEYAGLLTLDERNGYTVARVTNPWDSAKALATYILVPDSVQLPADMPSGTIIRTPVSQALVFTSVHSGLISEIGAVDAIGAVCGSEYITVPEIQHRIADGRITDCGNDASPDIERIVSASPDLMLISPYENNPSNSRLESMGAPIVLCADYMEKSPLARAEWVKFFGRLFGKAAEADSMFATTEREYLALKSAVAKTESRPSVIFDGVYGNQWYVPRRDATLSSYIRDAGGTNPFDNHPGAGSLPLSPEKILIEAGNADYWLVRYASPTDYSLSDFVSLQPIYKEFKAAGDENVYGCNTMEVPFYEETPFHPQWFLEQLVAIFHPELGITPAHTYFKRL